MTLKLASLILLLATGVGCRSEPIESKPVEVKPEKESRFQLGDIHSIYVSIRYNDDGVSRYVWINGNQFRDDIYISTSGIIKVNLEAKRKYTIEVER